MRKLMTLAAAVALVAALAVGVFGLTATAVETDGTLLVCQDAYTSSLRVIEQPDDCEGVVWELEGEVFDPPVPTRGPSPTPTEIQPTATPTEFSRG